VPSNVNAEVHNKGAVISWSIDREPGKPISGYNIYLSDKSLRDQLWKNVRYMHKELREAGLDIGSTKSQVIPVMAGNDLRLREISKRIQEKGLYTGVVTYPAVSKNKTRLRLSVSAKHTKEQMDECVRIIREVYQSLQ